MYVYIYTCTHLCIHITYMCHEKFPMLCILNLKHVSFVAYICIYLYVYMCMHIYIHVPWKKRVSYAMYTKKSFFRCIYICICIRVYAYIFMYIYMYIYIYINTHMCHERSVFSMIYIQKHISFFAYVCIYIYANT